MQLHTLAMLWATLRIPHSVLKFSNPLNINLRNPQFCFNLPNTASTSTGLLDRYLRPFSDSNLSLAAWRYCSSSAPIVRICFAETIAFTQDSLICFVFLHPWQKVFLYLLFVGFQLLLVCPVFQAMIDLFYHFIQLFTVNFFPFIPWSPYSSSSSASNSSVCSNKAFTFSCNLAL